MADIAPGLVFFAPDKTSRSVWAVIDPKDLVTGKRVTSPLQVQLRDVNAPIDGDPIAAKPIAARSGVYCFTDLKLPATDYIVEVKPLGSDRTRYFDSRKQFTLATIPLPAQPLERNPVPVELLPRPSYPFDAKATLARGRLVKESDTTSPIPDAEIFLILDTVNKGRRAQTDQRGEFAVFFPSPAPVENGDPPELKEFKFNLRFVIPNQLPHLTADLTVKEGTTKSLNAIKFPGT